MDLKKGHIIQLTASEVRLAVAMAGVRRYSAIAKGRSDYGGKVGFDWNQEIEAAGAELALAKHQGIYIDALRDEPGAGDVGTHEVKHTTSTNDTVHLIVAPGRVIEGVWYFLFTGQHPRYVFRGCCHGSVVARHPVENKFNREAHWIPEKWLMDWSDEYADLSVAPGR